MLQIYLIHEMASTHFSLSDLVSQEKLKISSLSASSNLKPLSVSCNECILFPKNKHYINYYTILIIMLKRRFQSFYLFKKWPKKSVARWCCQTDDFCFKNYFGGSMAIAWEQHINFVLSLFAT